MSTIDVSSPVSADTSSTEVSAAESVATGTSSAISEKPPHPVRRAKESSHVVRTSGAYYDDDVRAVALLLLSLATGCVSGDGDTVTRPSDSGTVSDTFGSLDGSIFPVDDSAVDETGDAVVVDTTASEVAPSCGVAGKPCCAGDVCGGGTYCNTALCWAPPTATEETGEPSLCGDLGKAHVAPLYLSRFTIRGRPGAKAYRYYIKTSCGTAPPSLTAESPLTIGTDGQYTFTIENGVDTNCTNANLGRYEVWFVVDGHETVHNFVSVYNSSCPSVSTCAAAASFCPPG